LLFLLDHSRSSSFFFLPGVCEFPNCGSNHVCTGHRKHQAGARGGRNWSKGLGRNRSGASVAPWRCCAELGHTWCRTHGRTCSSGLPAV
jgi:hypothetical protein